MSRLLIDALDALETATARRSRREKLLQAAERKVSWATYLCTLIILCCSLAALLIGARKTAAILALQACWVVGFAFVSNMLDRKKALRELQASE